MHEMQDILVVAQNLLYATSSFSEHYAQIVHHHAQIKGSFGVLLEQLYLSCSYIYGQSASLIIRPLEWIKFFLACPNHARNYCCIYFFVKRLLCGCLLRSRFCVTFLIGSTFYYRWVGHFIYYILKVLRVFTFKVTVINILLLQIQCQEKTLEENKTQTLSTSQSPPVTSKGHQTVFHVML